jgi:arylsulfatase A-like enzyme
LTNKIHTLPPSELKKLSKNSLPKYFKQMGYNTLAVVSNPWLNYHQDYFRDGFTHFKFVVGNAIGWEVLFNTTEVVTQTVSDFLETKLDSKGRNFFYIHYLDPHDPYQSPVDYGFFSGEPPKNPLFVHSVSGEESVKSQIEKDSNYSGIPTPEPISQNDLNYLVSQYDSEIRYVDFHIEKLLEKLQSMRIIDDSLIIITSDHGEEFLEHGCFKHGFQLFDETIHIPLIFYWKDHLKAKLRPDLVSGMDIAPTILSFCKVSIPSTMLGNKIFPEERKEPILFCTHFINQKQRGMRTSKWKLIQNVKAGEIKIFDLENDSEEKNNLFDGNQEKWSHLIKPFEELLEKHVSQEYKEKEKKKKLEIDPVTREQLKALGYL